MEIVRIQQNNYNANFKAKPKYRGSKELWHKVKVWDLFRTTAKRIGRAGDVVNLHISEPFQDEAGNFYRNLKISANLYNLGDKTFCEEKMLCDSQKDIIDPDKARRFFTDNLEQISWKQSNDLQRVAIQKLKEKPYANFQIRDVVRWNEYIKGVRESKDYTKVSRVHFIADIAHNAESYIQKGVDVDEAIKKAINELTKSRVYDAKSFNMELIIKNVHEFWAKGSQDYDVLQRMAKKR